MADMVDRSGLILTDWAANMAQQQNQAYLQQQRQREAQDYARTRAVEDAGNQARQQYASGNIAGARDTAAQGNAWDVWKGITDEDKAQVAAQATDIGSAAYNLARLPKGQARVDYFNAFVPTLRSHGMDDAEIQQYANSGFLDNDDALHGYADKAVGIQNLWKADQERIKGLFDRETDLMKPVTAADGAVLTRGEDGSYAPVYTPGTKPMQEILKNEDGSYSYVNVPGTAGNSYPSGTAPSGGDTSRVMNYEARARGFAAVPETVQTLGQFSDYATGLNRQGIRSSAAGTYQIVGDTMRRYAPKVLGQDWRNQPFNAQTQDRVAQAIFEDNNGSAAALRKQWVSLSQADAERIRTMPWAQARGVIAAGESGGSAPQGPGPRVNPNNGIQVQNLGGGRAGPDWKDETRELNGQMIVGQRNQKTGEFRPMGGAANKAPKVVSNPEVALQRATSGYDTVINLAKSPGLGYIVGKSSVLPIIPGTEAANANSMIDTIKSQVFLSQIDQMKGLGALTEAEGAKLTSAIASLDRRQSDAQFRKSLETIASYFEVAKRKATRAMQGGGQPQGQQTRVVNGRTYVKVQGGWKAQ